MVLYINKYNFYHEHSEQGVLGCWKEVVAWEKNMVATIAPREKKTWALSVTLGTGEQPFLLDDLIA